MTFYLYMIWNWFIIDAILGDKIDYTQINPTNSALNVERRADVLPIAKSDIDKLNKKAFSLEMVALVEVQSKSVSGSATVSAEAAQTISHESTVIKTDVSIAVLKQTLRSASGDAKVK